jgi:hypothetical protein
MRGKDRQKPNDDEEDPFGGFVISVISVSRLVHLPAPARYTG